RKSSIFDAEPTTVPVVSNLHRRILQKAEIGIEPQIRRSSESPLISMTIAEQDSKLVKGSRRRRRCRRRLLTRSLQVSIPTPHRKLPEPVVHKRRAGADSAFLNVVIQIPFRLGPRCWLNAQVRDDRRKPACIRQERYTGEVGCCGQYIALPGN